MTTTAGHLSSAGAPGENQQVWAEAPRPRPRPRGRRSWPMAAIGVVITAGSALAGLVVWDSSSSSRELLVAARAIPAGHVVGGADLRAIRLGGAESVSVVPVEEAAGLVGRAAALPVAAGALIPADLVDARGLLPPDGQVLAAVALRPGAVPPQAGPGAAVRVLPAPADQGAPAGLGRPLGGWQAVLVGVEPARSGDGGVVVSLQVAEADAASLAAAGSDVTVVVLSSTR